MKRQNTLKSVPEKNENASKFLIEFMREKGIGGKDFNFDQISHVKCEKHLELKDNFMVSEIEEYHKNDIICSTCLSDLSIKYNDFFRSKLYSGIIFENKDKILQIKNNEIDFEHFKMGKSLQVHTHNDISIPGDELLEFSHSFETNVIDKFTNCKTTDEELLKIKQFVLSILNENDEPNLRNIGQNEELKIRYIKLAYFLLRFKGLKGEEMDYRGLTKNLKHHILEIIKKRKKANESIDNWLELILGDFYKEAHELENVPYDEEFIKNLHKEGESKNTGSDGSKDIDDLKMTIKNLLNENENLKKVSLLNFYIFNLKELLKKNSQEGNNKNKELEVKDEEHINKLNKEIERLNEEVDKLKKLNSSQLKEINNLKNSMDNSLPSEKIIENYVNRFKRFYNDF